MNMGSSGNMEKEERIHQRVGLELERGSIEMNGYTSQLPQAEGSGAAHAAVADTLVDTEMRQFLMQNGIINHWQGSSLTPIQTIGDGNCLLHAVSLFLWGIQDKKLTMRRCLDRTMQQDRGALRKRWAHQRRARDAAVPGVPSGGVDYGPGQWDGEWDTMVQMASAAPNESESNQTRYRPLEEFYIFVLANLLCRPIVVFADTLVRDNEGNSFAPNPFGGIYLPLLHPPEDCFQSPILLAYNNQHFTPLLTTQTRHQNGASPSTHHPPQAISLMRQNGERLPVHYILPEEEGRDVLAEYLNIIPAQDSGNNTLLAVLDIVPLPDNLNLFMDFVEHVEEGTPHERNASPDLSSFQKPVSVVRPIAKATPTSTTTESIPVPCTEDVDGPQASHSPLEESFLRMKLRQGDQTATVVNPDQTRSPPADYTATSVAPLPVQENIAQNTVASSTAENFGRSQHTTAGPSGSSLQGNMASLRNGDHHGRSQQLVASEDRQLPDDMAMQHGTPNGRNQNSQDDTSVTSRPSYAAAVKNNPGPLNRLSTPKQKLFSTPSPKKTTCKNPECKNSPCPQNGGYCAKCHRKNSAEKRRERRESLSSQQGNAYRSDTHLNIGKAFNKRNRKKETQPTKQKHQSLQTTPAHRPQTTPSPSPSLMHQKPRQQARGTSTGGHSGRNTQSSATVAPHQRQSDSPETAPSKVFEASSSSIQSTAEESARLIETNARNVSSQEQVPDSVLDSNPDGSCTTPGCNQLALPSADGSCVNCWSKKQDAATIKMQQRQAVSGNDQASSNAPKNLSKEPGRKTAFAADRNSGTKPTVSPPQTCLGPDCEGLVDERINAGLCPTCVSHLKKNRSSTASENLAANGGASSSVPRNISKEPERRADATAGWNGGVNPGVPPQQPQPCTGCQGVVDERVHATLCPECFSHLERKNSSSTHSQMANGGLADNYRILNPSMSASSPAQPDDRFYTQQPDVRRCLIKGCNRNCTRENSYYCSVHTSRGTPQRGRQQVGPQSSANNTSQQFNSYSQPPPSISSFAPMSLNFHGNIGELHVHHHHHTTPDGPQSNATGGPESQYPYFSAPEEQQSSLRARGSGSASTSS